jgi:hypothetical protein
LGFYGRDVDFAVHSFWLEFRSAVGWVRRVPLKPKFPRA